MFYNGANCDLYIGKGAGRKLLKDIQNARKSVKIVSPYLSPFLVSELISLRKRNLEIELITTDFIEDFYENYQKNIHKLIIQNRKTDHHAVEKRKKWQAISNVLKYIPLGILSALIVAAYFHRDVTVAFGLILPIIFLVIIRVYQNKIKKTVIYSYWYSQFFPFKVFLSPSTTSLSDTFIHGKIYLIDDEIAYLGSLNFTASGTKYNYETRIRTIDTHAVKEIKEEIYKLFNNANIPEADIQYWGKQLYKEPIN